MTDEPLIVKNSEPSETQENIKKSLKNEAKKRRLELLGVIKKKGIKNTQESVKAWAKHYEVSDVTIYKDFKYIKKHYKPSEFKEIKMDLSIARDQALQQSLDILSKPEKSDPEKLEAIKVLIGASRHYREEMEAWGEKEKMPDKHQFEALPTTFNIIEKSVEEIKDARKNSGAGSEPETTGNPESSGG